MATFPTMTYSNITHKVHNGLSNGAVVYRDEQIAVNFSRTVDNLTPYKISYHSPYNEITGMATANISVSRFEIRVTPVEEQNYGPSDGARAFALTGIRPGTNIDFNIPINFNTFIGSPSGQYRVCLMAQSELDHSWDCTQLYMVVDTNDDFRNNYTEVKYIESFGTQYIDTDVRVKSSLRFEIELLPTSINTDQRFMGAYDDGIFLGQLGGKWRYGNTCDKNDILIDYSTKTIITASDTTWTFNGVQKTAGAIGNRGNKILLFAASYRADSFFGGGSCRLYKCKIYDGLILIREFIPVIRNSDQKPGLYDIISQAFYTNLGSGDDFVAGPLQKTLDLYQEIDYIETTGEQIIDTTVDDDFDITIDCKFEIRTQTDAYLFGSTVQSYTNLDGTISFTNKLYNGLKPNSFDYSWQTTTLPTYGSILSLTQRILDNDIYISFPSINESAASIPEDPSAPGDYKRKVGAYGIHPIGRLFIFGWNNGTQFYGSGLRLYYFKVYQSNVLIRDFIPVYRKSDHMVGLYDKVNDFFYQNQGSGAFTPGPCSDIPSEYQKLQHIESSGSQYLDTGIYPANICGIECCAKNIRPGTIQQFNPLLGRYTQNNTSCQILENYSTNTITARWLTQNTSIRSDNKYHKFYLAEDGVQIIDADNADDSRHFWPASAATPLTDNSTLYLFARRQDNSGSGIQQYGYWALQALAIIGNDAQVLRQYVPCYSRFTGDVGLFDLISGTFQKSSSDTQLIAGPKVISYSNKFQPIDQDSFEVHLTEETLGGGDEAEYTQVWLISCPSNSRTGVIKAVKSATGLGFKEAKDLVDNAPSLLFEGTPTEVIEFYNSVFDSFDAYGAVLELR